MGKTFHTNENISDGWKVLMYKLSVFSARPSSKSLLQKLPPSIFPCNFPPKLPSMRYTLALLSLIVCFLPKQHFAQTSDKDTLRLQLAPVTLTATRMNIEQERSPLAVSVVGSPLIQQGLQQLSLDESLGRIPGLFALNPDNFSQDLRISIRGFGARAAFGIRGIKLLVDGIPESTPDGQAQVDNLDLGILDRMEVIRGPSAGLYGNAAGGVISLRTEDAPEDLFVQARTSWGSFGFQQYQIKTGQQVGKFNYLIHANHTRTEGFRDQSGMKNTLITAKVRMDLDSLSTLRLLLSYVDSPQADDPGGITADQAAENPMQARDRNVQFNGGETVQQGRVGLVYTRNWQGHHQFQSKVYHTFRDFSNRLPFENGGIVNLDRAFTGGGLSYQYTGALGALPYRLRTGIDIENQRDDRQRFNNLNGIQGEQSLSQLEKFFNLGAYVQQELQLASVFALHASLRFDVVRLEAEDAFLSNGDDSGDLSFERLSPMVGLVYDVSPTSHLYGNLSTSFETPTLSELSANPDGSGGFNGALSPQKALNYEVGWKGTAGGRLAYELALFSIELRDELIPYELEAFPGRTFFRNAGRSRRNGIELSLDYVLAAGLRANVSYTYSDFTYTDFTVDGEALDGNQLPGLPKHAAFVGLRYQTPQGFYGNLQVRHRGALFTNDANTVEESAVSIAQVRAGMHWDLAFGYIEPYAGINNVFDVDYSSNVRINAFGSRFFEPAPGRNYYAGLTLHWGKR